ncbi:MAG: dinitrogenase iron-molybdenum cofactor biosynthesis protein [Desulfobulbus propionicus]|nr:MAG: dinitrogenase iron-molybdenum cofactor biosynthesis protein [Desulfobulbus propionicus]
MKVAITAKGNALDSDVDPRFGRASYIILVDTDTMESEALDNSANLNALKGAGIQAATMIADQGAQVVCTGYCGPKAFQTLQAAGIKVVSDVTGTVRQAVEMMQTGNVQYTDAANADAHW